MLLAAASLPFVGAADVDLMEQRNNIIFLCERECDRNNNLNSNKKDSKDSPPPTQRRLILLEVNEESNGRQDDFGVLFGVS